MSENMEIYNLTPIQKGEEKQAVKEAERIISENQKSANPSQGWFKSFLNKIRPKGLLKRFDDMQNEYGSTEHQPIPKEEILK